ncbi:MULTISPECIES: hypothetical protein [Thioclava]|uniref:hypothetical protein n=1 Tax=Thioclava TaxID=285107 RepID=UPI001FE4BD35|nr:MULTISPECIES: hypothetical protein [Thioclava]
MGAKIAGADMFEFGRARHGKFGEWLQRSLDCGRSRFGRRKKSQPLFPENQHLSRIGRKFVPVIIAGPFGVNRSLTMHAQDELRRN